MNYIHTLKEVFTNKAFVIIFLFLGGCMSFISCLATKMEQIMCSVGYSDELAGLCASPGYAHAIAYLCFRDNMIRYSGEMKAEDMQHLFSRSRLIRTETSTLIGLMLKNPIDYTLPAPPVLEKYIEATEALLEEIHHTMTASFW